MWGRLLPEAVRGRRPVAVGGRRPDQSLGGRRPENLRSMLGGSSPQHQNSKLYKINNKKR